MADLKRQVINKSNQSVTFEDAGATGDTYPLDDRTLFLVKNGGTVSITVTVKRARSATSKPGYGQLEIEDLTVEVPDGETKYIWAPPASYAHRGRGIVDYSDVSDVTVAAIQAPDTRL